MYSQDNQGPQTNPKLQAMIMGLGQGSSPMAGPPTAGQPGGFPRPTDPAASKFQIVIKALKALSDLVTRLGDAKCGNEIAKMATELEHKLIERTNAFVKAQETKAKTVGGDQPPVTSGY